MVQLTVVCPVVLAPDSRGAERCAEAEVLVVRRALRVPQSAGRLRRLRRQPRSLRHRHAAALCRPPRPQGSLQRRKRRRVKCSPKHMVQAAGLRKHDSMGERPLRSTQSAAQDALQED